MNLFLQVSILALATFKISTGLAQSKLKVTQEDYKKWHTLTGVKISPDGLWSSYKVEYEQGIDTLFVQEINSGRRSSFPAASQLTFAPDSKTVLITDSKSALLIYNLKSKATITIPDVSKFEFGPNDGFVAVLGNFKNTGQLLFYATNGKLLQSLDRVQDFEVSDDGKVAVIDSSGISIYKPATQAGRTIVMSHKASMFTKMFWNKNSNVLAFLQKVDSANAQDPEIKVFAFDLSQKRLFELDKAGLLGNEVTDYMQVPIKLSDDGRKLFFYYKTQPSKIQGEDLVEVWDSQSKLVYPAQKIYGDAALRPKIAVWDLATGAIKLLASDDLPDAVLLSRQKHVITYSYLSNEPQYEMIAPVDLYITNIETGTKTLLLEKHHFSVFSVGCSPSGRYINYFRNKNYFVYDCETDKHINLTANLNKSFDDPDFDEPGKSDGFTSAGWTADSKYLIVYDKYDIWLLSPNLALQRRITNGAGQKVRYRIAEDMYKSGKANSGGLYNTTFNLAEGLFIYATAYDRSTGCCKWEPQGWFNKIALGPFKCSMLTKSITGNEILYVKESYELPPSIQYWSKNHSLPRTIFRSNSHTDKYDAGTSQILNYKAESGQELQGALFYPAGFDPAKRYPMIVYIYSKLSSLVYDYNNPTMYNVAGFAHANYTSDGYLVLFPDIHYKLGDPGKSILECVTAGVEAVKEMGIVDEKKIGIIGHSYGGYETCHLLTRTSIFAAAVAGAAVTDMISSYLSVNTSNGVKMDWRYESQQYRMDSTPFKNLNGYLENSTVTNAANITTPLLSWAGKEDRSVDWKQSVELHVALRRLNKRNVFLAYPNEGHILNEPSAQYDLTTRIKNWFDHYLKNMPLQEN
jgi:dipeptidyl aminopeptidase/acylaminoacyl peptidase